MAEAGNIHIIEDDSGLYTVEAQPKVIVQGFIRLVDWRGELASVDGVFDLTNVDPVFLGMLQNKRTSVHLGDSVRPRPPKGSLEQPKPGGELSNTPNTPDTGTLSEPPDEPEPPDPPETMVAPMAPVEENPMPVAPDLPHTIDLMLAEIPDTEDHLVAAFKDIQNSARWASPEGALLWWDQAHNHLEEDVGDPTGTYWKEAVARIWAKALTPPAQKEPKT